MSTIKPLSESEIAKLRKLTDYSDSAALAIGRREAERRQMEYPDSEAISVGWKLIREQLRASGKLPRLSKSTKEQPQVIPSIDQIKDVLFKAWLEGKIKIK